MSLETTLERVAQMREFVEQIARMETADRKTPRARNGL